MAEQGSLDIKREITCFQFSERIKSELIIASRLLWKIEELKGDELAGAKKLMSSFLDALLTETNIAHTVVKLQDFKKASMKITEIKERIALDQYQEAAKHISEAISFVTTCGQRAAEALRERHLF